MIDTKILDFYKQTSPYTDLGLYKDFAKGLPDDIGEVCLLQRNQIIHPFVFHDPEIRKRSDCFWGDMTKVPITRLRYEDDLFPTAQSMLHELLRKDDNYCNERRAENKIHVTCRGQAILLASILKAKGYSARARSGFAPYIVDDGIAYDHWITEYYNEDKKRWVLVDADIYYFKHELGFEITDIPREKFIFGAEAYLGVRSKKYAPREFCYVARIPDIGIRATIRALFYDFHSLMNDEIIFLHLPKYIVDKDFELSEEEYQELDGLAKLMLEPDKNFDELRKIWETNEKFRIMIGGVND